MNPVIWNYSQWLGIVFMLIWLLPGLGDYARILKKKSFFYPVLLFTVSFVVFLPMTDTRFYISQNTNTFFVGLYTLYVFLVGVYLIYKSGTASFQGYFLYFFFLLLPGFALPIFLDTEGLFLQSRYMGLYIPLAVAGVLLMPMKTKFSSKPKYNEVHFTTCLSQFVISIALTMIFAEISGELIKGGGLSFLRDGGYRLDTDQIFYVVFYFLPLLIIISKTVFAGYMLRTLYTMSKTFSASLLAILMTLFWGVHFEISDPLVFVQTFFVHCGLAPFILNYQNQLLPFGFAVGTYFLFQIFFGINIFLP